MYDFRPTSPDESHLTRLAAFLSHVFPHARCFSPAYLDWMYFGCPEGKAISIDGYEDGEIVGHYAILPLRVLQDGSERRAGLGVNIAIHPAHRGHGLFRQLMTTTHEAFTAAGRDLVIAIANAQSTNRCVKHLDWRFVGPLAARIGLAGAAHDPTADSRVAFRRLWNAESFAWRFSSPSWVYRFETRRGTTRVFAPTRRLGIEAEMGVFPGDWPVPNQKRRYPARMHPLKVWFGLRPGSARDWPLSVRMPQRLRPSPLNMIVRDFGARENVPSVNGVDFRGADFDPY
jgi:GNAT superfamily N-acetyltransferase